MSKKESAKIRVSTRLRNYFLTGLVIAAPISITIYLTWTFIGWVDAWVKPWLPPIYNPDNYLPFSLPGVGLITALFVITLLGFLTANLVGRSILQYGEMMLGRMPLVRNIYSALKQIFETVLSQRGQSFQNAALIEYPRKGLWAIVFISTETKGEILAKAQSDKSEKFVSVFLPTTPNPTSGFLLFVPAQDVMILEMTVEEAAKLIISAGLVSPDYKDQAEAGLLSNVNRAKQAQDRQPEDTTV